VTVELILWAMATRNVLLVYAAVSYDHSVSLVVLRGETEEAIAVDLWVLFAHVRRHDVGCGRSDVCTFRIRRLSDYDHFMSIAHRYDMRIF
jgi:hypothetical protein